MCIITMYHDLKSRNFKHVVYLEQMIFFQYILYRRADHDTIHTPLFFFFSFFLLLFNNVSVRL